MNPSDAERIRTGLLIFTIERNWHQHFDQHVKHLAGITRHQWWLLIHLMRHRESGMSQTQLAKTLGVGKVALGKMVDRLERARLIERSSAQIDRRSKRVRINAQGLALVSRMEHVAADLGRRVMRQLDAGQQRQLNSLLETIKDNLHSVQVPRLGAFSKRAVDSYHSSGAAAATRDTHS